MGPEKLSEAVTSLWLRVWGQTGNGRSGGSDSFFLGHPTSHSLILQLLNEPLLWARQALREPSKQNLALVEFAFLRGKISNKQNRQVTYPMR